MLRAVGYLALSGLKSMAGTGKSPLNRPKQFAKKLALFISKVYI